MAPQRRVLREFWPLGRRSLADCAQPANRAIKATAWPLRMLMLTILATAAMANVAVAQSVAPSPTPRPDASPAAVLPAVVSDNASPSPVTIMNLTAYVVGSDVPQTSQTVGNFVYSSPGYTAYRGVACADFVNHGARPLTKASFAFSAASSSGAIIDVNSSTVSGLFNVADESRTALTRAHVCMEYPIYIRSTIGRFLVNVGAGRRSVSTPIAEVVVSPKQLTFDDGTTWQAQKPLQVGDQLSSVAPPVPSPASPGWPTVFFENVASAPFRITDAFTYDAEQSITFHSNIPQFGVCVALDSGVDLKQKQAQVVVAFITADGTVAGVDTIAMHGGRYYGECRASAGSIKDGTFMYRLRRGAPTTPIARVVVTQLSEDFADGTKWTNPAAPVLGAIMPADENRLK